MAFTQWFSTVESFVVHHHPTHVPPKRFLAILPIKFARHNLRERPLLLSIRCGILMLFNLLPLCVISGIQRDLQYWHWADVLQTAVWKGFSFIVPRITYKESFCKLQQWWSFCLWGMGCRLSCLLVLGMCQQDKEYSGHPERSFLQGTSLGAQT